jgi:hypothetical protein
LRFGTPTGERQARRFRGSTKAPSQQQSPSGSHSSRGPSEIQPDSSPAPAPAPGSEPVELGIFPVPARILPCGRPLAKRTVSLHHHACAARIDAGRSSCIIGIWDLDNSSAGVDKRDELFCFCSACLLTLDSVCIAPIPSRRARASAPPRVKSIYPLPCPAPEVSRMPFDRAGETQMPHPADICHVRARVCAYNVVVVDSHRRLELRRKQNRGGSWMMPTGVQKLGHHH